ncbi:MAG: efflux RND transporter periplasmic adaptor subunit [Fimbriimonas ginsengisoli]|uniref:Efflux RND transporter periplasmic adaptor subunit n=1 Tax=Fimbriimonas ginsengisoli TaxID=1005039 RepID=A0A931PWI5_FIMGI|nr:efflux RND transporter periplasmic adaptor subunit [Fimbriimonas ginsengisoli]
MNEPSVAVEPSPAEKSSGRRTKALRSRIVWALGALLLLSLAYWGSARLRKGSGPSLITSTVTRGDLIETVSATGSISAQTGAMVKIGSQITGRIKYLAADVGSTVKAGEVIAELDAPDLRAQLDQAKASLAQAQSRLQQQLAGVPLERAQTVSSIEGARQAYAGSMDRLQAAQANAGQQGEATASDIVRAEKALSSAQSNLSYMTLTAGLQIQTAKEQLAQAEANSASSAASLARLEALVAKGYASQAELDVVRAQAAVNASQTRSARSNYDLVKEKVSTDLKVAKDQVDSAQAGLRAAKSETQIVESKQATARDAQASVRQAQAAMAAAAAGISNDVVKDKDVQAARDAVLQAAAQVALNEAQMDKSFIRSPISGTVLQLSAQQGETIAAGLSAPTVIIVADLKRLEVDAFVDETDIAKVKLGQVANITVDAFPGRTFEGKVIKIASGSTIQQGVVSYGVTVSVAGAKEVLKPDMTANVTIQTRRRTNVLLVPAVAVQLGTRGPSVQVLETTGGEKKITRKSITTGGSDGVNIEVLKGLQGGEVVVMAGGAPQTSQGGSSFLGSGGGGPGGRPR